MGLYPLFCQFIDTGGEEQKKYIKDELKRLCELADNPLVKTLDDVVAGYMELLTLIKGSHAWKAEYERGMAIMAKVEGAVETIEGREKESCPE